MENDCCFFVHQFEYILLLPVNLQSYKTEQSNVMHRIKFYVIGLLFLGLQTRGNAQDDRKVNLGFTVSPSLSWLETTNAGYEQDGNSAGIKYGLLMDFRLFGVENYALATGFTMNHISGKLKEASYFSNSTGIVVPAVRSSKYKMTYIDMPLAIRLRTNEIGYTIFYGVFGTELGFNINTKKEYTDTYSTGETENRTDDVSADVNLFRSSLVFGAGVQRHISGNSYYRIGITYHNGLTNVLKGDAYKVDGNNQTLIVDNEPQYDRGLTTKLKLLELNLAIIF